MVPGFTGPYDVALILHSCQPRNRGAPVPDVLGLRPRFHAT